MRPQQKRCLLSRVKRQSSTDALVFLASALLLLLPLAAEGAEGIQDNTPRCVSGLADAEAIEGCTKILSLPDIIALDRAIAYRIRGNAYISAHELARAAADYESAQKLSYSTNAGYVLAQIDMSIGRNNEAIEELSKIVDAGKATAEVFNLRGEVYQNARDYDASIADMNKALFLNPKSIEALNNRGTAYAKKGNYEAAAKDIDAVLAIDPNVPMTLVNRCGVLAKAGKLEEGLVSCRKAEQLGGNDYFVIFGIGGIYYRAGRYEDAITYYTRSLALYQDNARVWYSRGMAYLKLGKREESESDFLAAERKQPDIAEVMAKAGMEQ